MITRRDLLKVSGLTALSSVFPASSQEDEHARDYRIEIAPVKHELSPRHYIDTIGYNGQVPGPLLRFREGRPVTIEVVNRSPRPEVVHWHGLFLPSEVDGAIEEGTPAIAPGGSARYTLIPRPAGFRWYHTHTMAMGQLGLGQYGGQHGPLIIEPRSDPGRYDAEFFLVLHDWEGRLVASDDGAMNPSYEVSTINGKAFGAGEPLRVARGQRVLLHVLNSSPTEVHWLALSGHRFRVLALDGNAVPVPQTVPMLRLAPAERVCALVEMTNPGVWVLGEVRRHVRSAGMAIVVEYADASGAPQWEQPAALLWGYEQFSAPTPGDSAPSAAIPIPLIFESKFRGHGAMEAWTINGRSYPQARVQALEAGQRYRLQFINKSADDHPMHLHRHSFELVRLRVPLENAAGGALTTRGIIKDVVLVDAGSQTDVEFTAGNPGATLLHCHQQNHMDLGFMMLLNYA